MKPGLQTIRALSRLWNEELLRGEEPSLWRLGDLLDDFRQRCATLEEKEALVSESPVWLDVKSMPTSTPTWPPWPKPCAARYPYRLPPGQSHRSAICTGRGLRVVLRC